MKMVYLWKTYLRNNYDVQMAFTQGSQKYPNHVMFYTLVTPSQMPLRELPTYRTMVKTSKVSVLFSVKAGLLHHLSIHLLMRTTCKLGQSACIRLKAQSRNTFPPHKPKSNFRISAHLICQKWRQKCLMIQGGTQRLAGHVPSRKALPFSPVMPQGSRKENQVQ